MNSNLVSQGRKMVNFSKIRYSPWERDPATNLPLKKEGGYGGAQLNSLPFLTYRAQVINVIINERLLHVSEVLSLDASLISFIPIACI